MLNLKENYKPTLHTSILETLCSVYLYSVSLLLVVEYPEKKLFKHFNNALFCYIYVQTGEKSKVFLRSGATRRAAVRLGVDSTKMWNCTCALGLAIIIMNEITPIRRKMFHYMIKGMTQNNSEGATQYLPCTHTGCLS